MELDVFPCGDMALPQGCVLMRYRSQGVQSVGGDDATRDLDSNHLYIRLPLSIYTLAQAEWSELEVIYLAGLKAL